MTVEEIVKELNSSPKLSKNHIVKTYMPYTQKMAFAKGIINTCSYEDFNGKKIYKRNNPMKMFLFSMRLIKEYTDIEFDDAKITDEYDALVSSGAYDKLLSMIPTEEVTILKGLMDMTQDDLEFNTRSMVSFFETKFESLDIAIGSLLNVLDQPEIKAKISELQKPNN